MKNLKTLLTVIALFAITSSSFGQKVKIKEGNLDFLSGVKELKLEYTYDNMKVGKYSEAEYVAKKKAEYNKKEAGKGDKWVAAWTEDRETRFEPKFEMLFSKFMDKVDVDASPNEDAKYTLILHTYFTEPGYYIGISSAPAMINTEAIFVESKNHDKVLCLIDMKKAPGRSGAGFDTGERIKEAYAKTGKSLAKFLLKKKAFK